MSTHHKTVHLGFFLFVYILFVSNICQCYPFPIRQHVYLPHGPSLAKHAPTFCDRNPKHVVMGANPAEVRRASLCPSGTVY